MLLAFMSTKLCMCAEPAGSWEDITSLAEKELKQQDLGAAEKSANAAVALAQNRKRSDLAISLIDLARIYKKQGRGAQALETYRKAVALKDEIPVYQQQLLRTPGVAHADIGRFPTPVIFTALRELAETLEQQNQLQAALDTYDELFELWGEHPLKPIKTARPYSRGPALAGILFSYSGLLKKLNKGQDAERVKKIAELIPANDPPRFVRDHWGEVWEVVNLTDRNNKIEIIDERPNVIPTQKTSD